MSAPPPADARPMTPQQRRVILASSLGTVFEWYDFYLFGALAPIIAAQFFAAPDPGGNFVLALLAFAAGFVVRPFGAVVFGRLGDLMGRKHTFLVTVMIMGMATVAVGLLPNYASIGVAAPALLVVLRLLQGLALGGEYGGAVTYVAEHAPPGRRGEYTAWIQTTATLGLFLSLVVVLGVRAAVGEAAFAEWGWRVPFLGSALLLVVSIWMRLALDESPAFERMRAAGQRSRQPLREALGRWGNLKLVLLAVLGLTAGQAVIWYSGQFYALFFLTHALQVDSDSAQLMLAAALLIGTPFFVVFGALSDRIGRKPVIMAGCLLAALSYQPMFGALARAANPDLAAAQAATRVVVHADPAQCAFQGSPVTRASDHRSGCDIAKRHLAGRSVSYEQVAAAPGQPAGVQVGERLIVAPEGVLARGRLDEDSSARIAAFRSEVDAALAASGYPSRADPDKVNTAAVVAILVYLVILVSMVYGPIAAMLAELFPTRIRYTSVSLPYHLGNGWFGGLLPAAAFAIVAQTGNMYSGLWYPIAIAAATCLIGTLFLPETRSADIAETGGQRRRR